MKTTIITKGLPLSLLMSMTEFDFPIDLTAEDEWIFEVSLRHKTERGPEPFELTVTPSNGSFIVDLTAEQTSLLNSNDNQYVLVIKVSKTDGTVNLRNTIQMAAVDDL